MYQNKQTSIAYDHKVMQHGRDNAK